MNFWLTTDTHINHAKLVEYGRPDDFEERVLSGLGRIPAGDALIHLGDICIGDDEGSHAKLMAQLSGVRRILVKGNHDHKSVGWYYDHGWDFVCDSFRLKVFGQRVWFKHIPAPKLDFCTMQIHGHTHGDRHRESELDDFYDEGYHKELALENTAYQPVKLETFINGNTN